MNKAILMGNLTKKPEKALTSENKEISKFTIAVDGASEKVEFIDIVAFDKIASSCNQFLDKGRKVLVEGEFRQRRWEDSTGRTHYSWSVYAKSVTFVNGSKNDNTYASFSNSLKESTTQEKKEHEYDALLSRYDFMDEKPEIEDDDIPF